MPSSRPKTRCAVFCRLMADVMCTGVKLNYKIRIHKLIDEISNEVYEFIKDSENSFNEGWVPATYIKDELGLKLSSYPQENEIDNKTGWFFSTIARYLQDKSKVKFKKTGNRSFYKTL